MNMKLASIMLATAAVTGLAGEAIAGGDVIYTGIKDYAAVPVPAPVPIPVYEPEYYVRFDAGAAWLSNGTLEEYGSSMTTRSIDDIETLEFGSIGAGRYITPSLRAELAVDLFTRGTVDQGDKFFNETLTFNTGLPDPAAIDVVTYDVTRTETIKFEQDIGMLNFYYDILNTTRFTPYIGAGIGVTYRQLTRTSSEFATCSSLSNAGDPTRNCSNNVGPDTVTITEGTSSKKAWDFAGALMAGVAIQVSDSILWDTGYRYLWQSGGLAVDSQTLTGTSTVEIKDIGQHQLRTGIRINID